MVKGKTFFIVPGFRQQSTDREYQWLRTLLKASGFSVIPVPIVWERRTMDDYCADFESTYKKYKTQENYILGFSYGAVIAFLTAQTLGPKKIFLCSLSPDFKEDVSAMSSAMQKYIGKSRVAHSRRTSAKAVAKELTVPSVVFCGEVEGKKYPQLMTRCRETVQIAARSKLVMVERAPHRIDFPAYQTAITEEIKDL